MILLLPTIFASPYKLNATLTAAMHMGFKMYGLSSNLIRIPELSYC